MAVSEEETSLKDRDPLWSIKSEDRALFNGISFISFLVCVTITVVIPLFGDKKPTFDAAIKASITSAGASVVFAFVVLGGKDTMGALTEWVRKKNFEQGEKSGIEKGIDQRDQQWNAYLKQKGIDIPSPPLPNGKTSKQ